MQITYNDIVLPFQRVTNADDRVVYTDDNTDALHVRRELTVEAVLVPEAGTGLPGEAWTATVARIAAALEQPRKRLMVNYGGGVYVECDGDTDLKNGPLPQGVRLTNFAGRDASIIQFTIVFHTPVCPARSRNPRWISHRWSEKLSVDPRTWAKTWTRTGTLHIRPGEPGAGLTADSFRGVVTPPIRKGYLRNRPPEYTLSSDGLSLQYSFADEQQYAMPPPGAIWAEGNVRVGVNQGIYRQAEVTVRLGGDVGQDKYALLQIATLVAINKLEDAGARPQKDGTKPLLSGALETPLWKNEVTVSLRALLAPPGPLVPKAVSDTLKSVGNLAAASLLSFFGLPGMITGVGIAFGLFEEKEKKPGDEAEPDLSNWLPKGATPPRGLSSMPWGYDAQPPDPGTGGSGVELIAAALQDPCLAPPARSPLGGEGNPIYANQTPKFQGVSGMDPPNPGGSEGELRGGDFGNGVSGGPAVTAEPGSPEMQQELERVAPWLRVPELARQEIPDWFTYPTPNFNVSVTGSLVAGVKDQLTALHTDYRIRQRWLADEGKVPRTEMRKDGLTHFIVVKAKTRTLVVEWTAERVGTPPDVLPQNLGDDNFVFLGGEFDPGTWETGEDGVTSVFRVSGEYRYGVKDAAKAVYGMSVAPWVAELMGKDAKPIVGPGGVAAFEPETGAGANMETLRAWRDGSGDSA